MENRIIVGITGHRPHKLMGGYDPFAFENKMLTYVLKLELEKLLKKYNEVVCISGMALGVDTIYAIACLELKDVYHDRIKLICATPFANQSSRWRAESKMLYDMILSMADGQVNTSGLDTVPAHDVSAVLQNRNEWIVDNSQVLWAVWGGTKSGTANCVNYARQKGLEVNRISTGLITKKEG